MLLSEMTDQNNLAVAGVKKFHLKITNKRKIELSISYIYNILDVHQGACIFIKTSKDIIQVTGWTESVLWTQPK
jgi:hypothetical protein